MNNKKKTDSLEEKAILNSLGLLDKSEEEDLLSKLNEINDDEKTILREFNNLTSLITQTLVVSKKEIAPSSLIKKKLFEKINSNQKNKSGFEFVFAGSDEWVQHPEIEGIKVKRLAVNQDKDYLMILMKAAAGAEYPAHHHSGAEECYVIEGDLHVEGKILGPGDFHHAEGDSDHDPLRTKNGCTLLLVVDPKDY